MKLKELLKNVGESDDGTPQWLEAVWIEITIPLYSITTIFLYLLVDNLLYRTQDFRNFCLEFVAIEDQGF